MKCYSNMVRLGAENSIRKEVYQLWFNNNALQAKEICSKLELIYKDHGRYVNKLLSEFRSNPNIGIAYKPQGIHHSVFVWKNVPFSLLPDYLENGFVSWKGWKKSSSKNGMCVFKDTLGIIHWYKNGSVRLYSKSCKLADVKSLFSKAFHWLTNEILLKYLDAPLRESSRHYVFDVDGKVPRFDINHFTDSHGLQIVSDGSHPDKIEVIESIPFWVKDLQKKVNQIEEFIIELKNDRKEDSCGKLEFKRS